MNKDILQGQNIAPHLLMDLEILVYIQDSHNSYYISKIILWFCLLVLSFGFGWLFGPEVWLLGPLVHQGIVQAERTNS